jgi:hypothetical protein
LYGLSDITGYPDSIAYKLIKIADGKAEVPLYTMNSAADSYSNAFIAYQGNDAVIALNVLIIADDDGSHPAADAASAIAGAAASQVISSGSFSSGNMSVSWNDEGSEQPDPNKLAKPAASPAPGGKLIPV